MRLSYYGYYLLDQCSKHKYLVDLRPFFRSFCGCGHSDLKSRVMHHDTHLYLFHLTGSLYVLMRTRSDEVARRAKDPMLSVSGVYGLFEHGEYLGFASYVLLGGHYLALAYTMLAPKAEIFEYFVDQVFQSVGMRRYKFATTAFLHQASKDDILQSPSLGKTAMEVNECKALVRTLPDKSLENLVVKTKEILDGQLTDVYLDGMGQISDSIDRKDASALHEALLAKVASSILSTNRLKHFCGNDAFSQAIPDDIAILSDPASWTSSLPNPQ